MEPIVVDNLRTGSQEMVRWGPFVRGVVSDVDLVRSILREYAIDAVIHFAGSAYVGESVAEPRLYFANNVVSTLALLDAMLDVGVNHIVFSSSCTVYGVPGAIPITEDHPKCAISPYGESKLFVERTLHWYGRAYGLSWAALRYFNAAGADPDGEIGELHEPETHLIPLTILAALGRRSHVEIWGTDYLTRDGTAIRDYVHVSDLARAHVLALQHLLSGRDSLALNLGTGNGLSVRDVIRVVQTVSGLPVPVLNAERRAGDPPALVADPSRAREALGWEPVHSLPESIVQTALRWHTAH